MPSKFFSPILEHCVVQGPNGPYYAWSTDLEGHTDVYDEPPGSLLLLPYLGFCALDDPAYQNTSRARTKARSVRAQSVPSASSTPSRQDSSSPARVWRAKMP